MVTYWCIGSTDLAGSHHFALVAHVLLTHVHLVICLLLLTVVRLAWLLEELNPVLHAAFVCDLVTALIRRLWLLARFLLVEGLVVLRRLGPVVSA